MSAAENLQPAVQFKLNVVKGPHAGQSFRIASNSFTIGRGPENEIVLINDAQISRQHARIYVSGKDIEVLNLSNKNAIYVGNESIQKWKLLNDSKILIGESEIEIQFDMGISVVPASLPQLAPVPDANSILPQQAVIQAATAQAVAARSMAQPQAQPSVTAPAVKNSHIQASSKNQIQQQRPNIVTKNAMAQQQQYAFKLPNQMNGTHKGQSSSESKSSKMRFYLICAIVIGAVMYFFLTPEAPVKKKSAQKSTIKYEDEFAIKQNSQLEKELEKKRQLSKKAQSSPSAIRIQENLQKGLRDFYLGNYSRAQDYFQVVLNLDSGHVLARRHLYLSQVRFDEIVKSKLILGESYYQKHNFRMCMAMFQQVKDMLNGKSNDLSYQKAQTMLNRCELASEGIR